MRARFSSIWSGGGTKASATTRKHCRSLTFEGLEEAPYSPSPSRLLTDVFQAGSLTLSPLLRRASTGQAMSPKPTSSRRRRIR